MDINQRLASFFDLFLGLPVHPLVVHGVVVLVPLYAVWVAYRVVKNRSISRSGIWIGFFLVLISVVTRLSGHALASRIGYDSIEASGHLRVGDLYPIAMISFYIFVILHNKSLQSRRRGKWWLAPLVKGVVVVGSVGLLFVTLWAGHSGATSHWQGVKDYTEFGDFTP
ncbi:MAG: hypothetical protein RIS09_888 [Actinomycetota bacterium]